MVLQGFVWLQSLNKATIAEKFPISYIEPLLNELHGEVVYSKLVCDYGTIK